MYTLFSPKRTSWVHLSKLIWTNVANSQNNKYVEFNILRFQHSCTKLSLKKASSVHGYYGLKLRFDCCVSCHTAFSQIKAPQAKISNNTGMPRSVCHWRGLWDNHYIVYMHTDTLLWQVSKLYRDYGTLDFQQLFEQTKQFKYWLRDFEDNVVVFVLLFYYIFRQSKITVHLLN